VREAGQAPAGTEELILDVTDAGQIREAAAGIEELHGLVNNAGIAIAAPLEFLPPDELRRQLEVNVIGQLAVTQAFLPALRRARGRIVNIGSIAGRSALPFLGAYAASKFALEAITDSLRVELAPFGIEVSVVEPGTIATPIWSKPQRNAEAMPPEARRALRRPHRGVPGGGGEALERRRARRRGREGRRARADRVPPEDALPRRPRREAPRPPAEAPRPCARPRPPAIPLRLLTVLATSGV